MKLGDNANNHELPSTRSYSVGGATASLSKIPFPPARGRWEKMFQYIEATPSLHDIVVSGGDSYYLHHEHLLEIGSRLLSIPHIRRFRFATKGDVPCPSAVELVLTLYAKVLQ